MALYNEYLVEKGMMDERGLPLLLMGADESEEYCAALIILI